MAAPGGCGRVSRSSTRTAQPATKQLSRHHRIELSQSTSPPSIPNIDDQGSAAAALTSCVTRPPGPLLNQLGAAQLEWSDAGTEVEADLASPQTESDRVGAVPSP